MNVEGVLESIVQATLNYIVVFQVAIKSRQSQI